MKIGYPCINRRLECRGNRTFRLASYSNEKIVEIVSNNLDCLYQILDFNQKNRILFFRITSDLIPFASHSICTFPWQNIYRESFSRIGNLIKQNGIRISMHPDQFTLINSPNEDVFYRSVKELEYHSQILDLLELDSTAKIQIHVGGVYNDKKSGIKRFVKRYQALNTQIKRRLVVENDDRLYSLKDCLEIHQDSGIPILFDVFHHCLNNRGETIRQCLELSRETWEKRDGLMMVDYSSAKPGGKSGSHAQSIDMGDFTAFIKESKPIDFDLMLEIKDKEDSAIKAIDFLKNDPRFI